MKTEQEIKTEIARLEEIQSQLGGILGSISAMTGRSLNKETSDLAAFKMLKMVSDRVKDINGTIDVYIEELAEHQKYEQHYRKVKYRKPLN